MKKNLLIFLTLVFFSPFVVNAEELKMEWQKNWGGNNNDYFKSIALTEDGGFVVIGYSLSTDIEGLTNKGYADAIILKYDKDEKLLWQKNWGGNNYDGFESIALTEDGGFVVIGDSRSTDIEGITNKGNNDAIIVKYDKDGNLLWQKNWGGNNNDNFESIALTEDGGFVVIGYSRSTNIEGLTYKGNEDIIIVKYDKDGNLLWQKNWGGNNYDEFYSIALTEDGGFVVIGYSNSTDIEGITNKGNDDIIILKYDKDGTLLWQKNWGGNSSDYFYSIALTEDCGFVVIGYSQSTDIEGLTIKGNNDAIIVKYDKDGNLLWQKNWGENSNDYFKSIELTEDGGFVVIGHSESTDIEGPRYKGDGDEGGTDAIILKYDKDGNLLWQKNWGGNDYDYFESIALTEDGGFVVIGYSQSTDIEGITNKGWEDGIIVKYDKDGNLLWQKNWGGNDYDCFDSIALTEDGGFVVIGYSESTDIEGITDKGGKDGIIVKYSIEYDLENVNAENGTSIVEQQGKYGIVTPTPNEGYEVDKIIIKDKDGNVLDVDVNKQEDGTYSFELYTDVSVEVIYKEKIENPKTGILDVITILFVGLFISLSAFFIVKRYNERLEF